MTFRKMKAGVLSAFCLAVVALLFSGSAAAQASDWKQIKTPPLPAFQPQQPVRVQLPNGMVLFLQEDHELPLIDAVMRIRGGSREEPAEKVGLVMAYGSVWRTGGTKTKTGDELDDFLEARAAKIETDDGVDSTTIGMSCLKADFDAVFAAFLDLLRNPEFRQDKLDLTKDQINSVISRRNDGIEQIAGREAAKLAYGKDNPYARVPEYSTVGAINRDDLFNWHKQWIHPNNAVFGITGDFDPKQMEQKLRAAFESWQKGLVAPKFETAYTPAKPGTYFINKEDVNQSEIRLVTLGIQRDNPDYFAVQVLNEVFGGGFSSRLFSRIRTAQGLAYAVYGSIGASYDHPGVFRIGMGTKSATTVQAIESLRTQLDDLTKSPVTEAELRRAKDAILNSFIFNLDTPEKILREKMAYEFYGYPLDFMEKYRAAIEKVTAEDVARVAQKYVHKEQMSALIVGNEGDMGSAKLTTLGEVTPIDITIPVPKEASAEVPSESNAEGKALMAKFVKAMGGSEALAKVKAIQQKSTRVAQGPQGEMKIEADNYLVFPDRLFSHMAAPQGEMIMVSTPTTAFMSMGPQSRDLPGAQKEEIAKSLKRDFIAVAQHADDPKYVFAAGGTEKVGSVEADVLKVDADGASSTWYLDRATGLPMRTQYSAVGGAGPMQRVVDYADWKPVSGIQLWTKRTITENGEVAAQESVQQWTINPEVDPRMFQKPTLAPQAGK